MTTKRALKPAPDWQSLGSPADLAAPDRLAHEIVTARRDLMPSVNLIMSAGLDADATLRALELFKDSLTTVGDVNRDPRVAIARCQAENA
jgi:hypothetical protein